MHSMAWVHGMSSTFLPFKCTVPEAQGRVHFCVTAQAVCSCGQKSEACVCVCVCVCVVYVCVCVCDLSRDNLPLKAVCLLLKGNMHVAVPLATKTHFVCGWFAAVTSVWVCEWVLCVGVCVCLCAYMCTC